VYKACIPHGACRLTSGSLAAPTWVLALHARGA
jgi:hypothetical protein